jgi:hypothetical protein
MKGYNGLFIALIFVFCATAGIPAHATTYDYYYEINTPSSLTNGASGVTFNMEWVGAPLNANGIGYGIYGGLNGSPVSGYNLNSVVWTTASGNSGTDSEIFLQFKNDGGDLLAYTFIEPNSFWATTGTNLPFPLGESMNGLLKWPDSGDNGVSMVWGPTQEGAMYGDPTPCDGCTVTISRQPEVAATPEPGSFLLLGSGLAGMVGFLRRKMARA